MSLLSGLIPTGEMINRGAILEVKRFIKLKIPKNKTASKAIGISEIKDFLTKIQTQN